MSGRHDTTRQCFTLVKVDDEYAQLLGKLQWLNYPPPQKNLQKNQQNKHNFLSYSCCRIFQMITSFFEAVAWFFPFVGIILIIYFPVPWAKNLRPFDRVQPKKTGAIFMEQKLRPGWHQLSKKVIKGAFLSKSILGSWLIFCLFMSIS